MWRPSMPRPARNAGGVTTNVTPNRQRTVRMLWVVVPLILIVSGVGGTLVYRAGRGNVPPKKPEQDITQRTALWAAHPEQQLLDAQEKLGGAQTPQEKAAAYESLGLAYVNNGQLSKGIEAYNQAVALRSATSDKVDILIEMVSAYNGVHDQANAIDTLQRIVQVLQQSADPALQAQIPTYQTMVQRLSEGEQL